MCMLPVGCVAAIHEERVVGAERTTARSREEIAHERRPAGQVLTAERHGEAISVRVEAIDDCRDVRTTGDMVRDVHLVRSFADDAQERNVASAFLLAAAVGVLAYAANQPTCPPEQGGCSVGAATAGEYALVGLSAVPLAFVAYNALRVRDVHITEAAPSRVDDGEWRPCGRTPAPGEPIEIVAGERIYRGVTDADGRLAVSMAALEGAGPAGPTPSRVLVRHPGTGDVLLDVSR
ncbi:MAG TPA: hypothetical protein VMN04_09115 [Thermoanaerobaculia bacterium]|nr:hypothetical protein [Thermoanaerobaculia bacterium]